MPEQVLIIGAGGHGRVVLDILAAAGRFHPAGFLDADVARHGQSVAGLTIMGAVNLLPRLRRQGIHGAIVAIGDNRTRMSYAQLVRQAGLELISAIHPSAIISPSAKLGDGVCVAPGVIIGTDASVGNSVILNSGCIVDHECVVCEGVHIAPGAILAGRVTVETGAFVAIGAKVLPCLTIGRGATVGAGAVVLENVPPDTTVVGVPACPIRSPNPVAQA